VRDALTVDLWRFEFRFRAVSTPNAQFGRNYLADSGLERWRRKTGSAAMRLQTYRDESHFRHLDLISGGKQPRPIDLVVILTSILLVVGAACVLIADVSATGTVGLAHWVR
jgi:hypothetical protein